MTSKEAIDTIYDKYETCEFYFAENDCYPEWCEYDFLEASGVAISAFKEIQQYRESCVAKEKGLVGKDTNVSTKEKKEQPSTNFMND